MKSIRSDTGPEVKLENSVIETPLKKQIPAGLLLAIVLLLIATVFLFLGGPENHSARSVKALWDLGHIVYFVLLTVLLLRLRFIQKLPVLYLWAGLLLFSLALGTLIEVLQYDTHRTPDVVDISRDLTGCLLVLSFHPLLLTAAVRFYRILIRILALIALGINLAPLTIALLDESIARAQFPVLSDLSTPFEPDRWGGGASREVVQLDAQSGSYQLRIGLTTAQYSGVGMQYLPRDWRAYKSVNLRIFQPADESLEVVIRIHDLEHETGLHRYEHNDRFNRSYWLDKGWNEIQIPLSEVASALTIRKMDLTRIQDISLFAISLPAPRVIYLDRIFLAE